VDNVALFIGHDQPFERTRSSGDGLRMLSDYKIELRRAISSIK